ncbi:MAG: tRNA (adenosine(37)-N6)-dimethylallyltransferase MiaA, partial [Clostridia bacterium]|nr:tRNA (adenosine(37)-N6)-dimethylallyltransferase MiaA [Clostridia bacterium]
TRVNIMWEMGLLDEVKRLLECGLTWDNQCMQAIGYKEFRGYFEGLSSLDDVKDAIITNTKRYAKRQITWLKKYENALWYNMSDKKDAAMSKALQLINDN